MKQPGEGRMEWQGEAGGSNSLQAISFQDSTSALFSPNTSFKQKSFLQKLVKIQCFKLFLVGYDCLLLLLSIIVYYRSLSTFHCQSQKVTWFKKLYSSSSQPLYESLKSPGRENIILNLHLFFCCKPHLRLLL